MKTMSSHFCRTATMAVAVFAASLVPSTFSRADPAGDTTDPLTGYHCVSQGCMSVSLPNADCICVKRSAGVGDDRKIVLDCSAKQDGRWVACPVKPRYSVFDR
jgi:hypothetical protein